MLEAALIFIGGGLGALARYALGLACNQSSISPILNGIPLGTLIANWIGCLLLGILMGAMPLSSPIKLALTTGLMGGLTTFSTFSVEGAQLISQGELLRSVLHIALHVGIGLLLATLGLSLGSSYAKGG